MPRRFPIAQFPNRSLAVALVAQAVAARLGPEAGRGARNLSNLALLVWSYQEATEGVNWFRNLLGYGGIAYSVAMLVSKW